MPDVVLLKNVYDTIVEDVSNQTIIIPRIPSHVIIIDQYIRDENKSVKDIVHLIEAEPSLIARILQIANSPLYSSFGKVNNIAYAISRLGMQMTRNIIIALSIRDVFRSSDPYINLKLQQVWNKSVEIAATSMVIAKNQHVNIDTTFLGSMLHNIGILAVAGYWMKYGRLRDENKEVIINNVAEVLNYPLGNLILSNWNFPEEFIKLFNDLGQPCDINTKVVPADIINISKNFISVQCDESNVEEFNASVVSKKLNMTYDQCAEMIDEYKQTIDYIKQPFK